MRWHPTVPFCLAACLVAAATTLPGGSAAAAAPLCYEKLSGVAARQDIEQLRLDLRGQRVAGEYRWIPWQKDRRLGSLAGRLTAAGTARVLYRYSQEGQQAQAPLTIVFNARQARISWDGPAHADHPPQPPVLLPRRACAQLKPVALP